MQDNIAIFNKKLQWQITNQFCGLCYIKLNQDIFQLVVFTNSLFPNNKDVLLQIDYIICLVNAVGKVNIIHRSLIKYNRVINIVLAAELYEMVNRFNIEAVIKATLENMLGCAVLLILYTKSKSLYNGLVKLKTTQKKQLILHLMSLSQSYEQ